MVLKWLLSHWIDLNCSVGDAGLYESIKGLDEDEHGTVYTFFVDTEWLKIPQSHDLTIRDFRRPRNSENICISEESSDATYSLIELKDIGKKSEYFISCSENYMLFLRSPLDWHCLNRAGKLSL